MPANVQYVQQARGVALRRMLVIDRPVTDYTMHTCFVGLQLLS